MLRPAASARRGQSPLLLSPVYLCGDGRAAHPSPLPPATPGSDARRRAPSAPGRRNPGGVGRLAHALAFPRAARSASRIGRKSDPRSRSEARSRAGPARYAPGRTRPPVARAPRTLGAPRRGRGLRRDPGRRRRRPWPRPLRSRRAPRARHDAGRLGGSLAPRSRGGSRRRVGAPHRPIQPHDVRARGAARAAPAHRGARGLAIRRPRPRARAQEPAHGHAPRHRPGGASRFATRGRIRPAARRTDRRPPPPDGELLAIREASRASQGAARSGGPLAQDEHALRERRARRGRVLRRSAAARRRPRSAPPRLREPDQERARSIAPWRRPGGSGRPRRGEQGAHPRAGQRSRDRKAPRRRAAPARSRHHQAAGVRPRTSHRAEDRPRARRDAPPRAARRARRPGGGGASPRRSAAVSRRILLVDDDPAVLRGVSGLLGDEGYRAETAATAAQADEVLLREPRASVILDLGLPGESGLSLLARLPRPLPAPVVVLSGGATPGEAAQAPKLGRTDFIEKPPTAERVLTALQNALALRDLEDERERLREELAQPGNLIGESTAMAGLRKLVARAGPSDSVVLVLGETGTGKERVARALHLASGRKGRFVAVNCAAIPAQLLESELFGAEKGAYTGPPARRPGRFEQAQKGTLLLDEIGELPLDLQAKLLRVLEEREVTRLGGSLPIAIDVRVLAATNRDLRKASQEGRFREDLYYRLPLSPPPPAAPRT